MKIKLFSQISLYGTVMLASLILSYAEGVLFPQGLTIPIALTAYYVTEHRKLFTLSTFWANLFGLLAIFLAGSELFFGSIEARLLSGAHLLVYLMWIVLFQKKEQRLCWWLMTLSLLQVSVGAVLTQDGSYGILLLMFLFTTIWTLSLFWICQVQAQFEADSSSEQASFNLIGQDQSHKKKTVEDIYAVYQHSSYSRNTVCRHRGENWISIRFVLGVLGNIIGAIIISGMFFILIPRLWLGNSRLADVASEALPPINSLTGFTEEVRLGDFGKILESTDKALDIKLFNEQTDEPIDVETYTASLGYEEPYFRGSVLERYIQGRWKLDSKLRSQWLSEDYQLARTTAKVRQEITQYGLGTEKLFAIQPFISGSAFLPKKSKPTKIISEENRSFLMFYPVKKQERVRLSRQRIHYKIYSPLTIRKIPAGMLPVVSNSVLSQKLFDLYTSIPEEKLPYLMELTDRVVGPKSRELSELKRAKTLEKYLRDSGDFTYSLDTSIQDPSIDPVEDFLKNKKSGHCEYYASALTLMLRRANIPARMVSGFKGGTKNRFNGMFEVQQRHAHAWVEAYLGGKWVNERILGNRGRWSWRNTYRNGYWVVLDATPAARASSVESLNSSLPTWHELRSLISTTWNEYVVQMNYSRQRSVFYKPLKKKLSNWWENIADNNGSNRSLLPRLKSFVNSPEQWFSLTSGIVSFSLMIILSVCVWLYRRYLPKWIKKWGTRRQTKEQLSLRVDFYDRFKKLCDSRGLTRYSSETQREFVRKVEPEFQEQLSMLGQPAFLQELVRWFYQVRFGETRLDQKEYHSLHNILTQLESLPQAKNKQRARGAHKKTGLFFSIENKPVFQLIRKAS